jgi:hypothetical protein
LAAADGGAPGGPRGAIARRAAPAPVRPRKEHGVSLALLRGMSAAAHARPREGGAPVADLKDKFSRKEWKDCCGKGCKKCDIAQAYIGVYGKKKGLDKLNEDRHEVKAKKKAGGKKKAAKAGKKS